MNKKLYVGNLSYDTTESGLRSLFGEVGAITDAVVIQDRQTGHSRGFGFVEMASEEEAKSAIEQLNGKDLDGRTIKVAEANPPRERSDRNQSYNRW